MKLQGDRDTETLKGGSHGRDRMVVEFTCAISADHH